MSGTDSTPYYQQLCISKDPLTVETAKVQQQKIMIEMGERYGREMMLFVYVPERNIYFVSTEEGTTYAYQRAFKEKIISYIANQYQEPEKNWIFISGCTISSAPRWKRGACAPSSARKFGYTIRKIILRNFCSTGSIKPFFTITRPFIR